MKNSLPIVFIALSLGLFYVYISPQYANIKLLSSEKSNYDDVLEKSIELRQLREQLREKMQGFSSADLGRLEKMIPQGIDPTELILDLDNIARRYGIVMLDMKTELVDADKKNKQKPDPEDSSGKPYQTFSLTFNFTAPYERFISFMSSVESSLRIMDVNSIVIKVDEKDPRIQTFEVNINSYWLK